MKCNALDNEVEFNVEYIEYFENEFEDHPIFRLMATCLIFNGEFKQQQMSVFGKYFLDCKHDDNDIFVKYCLITEGF